MSLTIQGKIITKMPSTSGTSKTGSTWLKQDFVIETFDKFPRKVMMSVMGDKVQELAKCGIGTPITAHLNIESREYNERWYTDIRAWKIEINGDSETASPHDNDISAMSDSTSDDLPF